ncbi:MAG: FecR domain-containing protein [Solitalea sp.]
MLHEPSYINELFSRFMAGRCSPDEIETLIAYLQEADDETILPTVEEFREAYPDLDKMDPAASTRVFQKLQEEIAAAKPPLRSERGKRGVIRRLPGTSAGRIVAAAATVLLIVISTLLYQSLNRSGRHKFDTGNAEIKHLELKDGTRVTLNANSSIQVRFSAGIREVWLDGEAFFRVAHDSAKKFTVHTSDKFSVEVLGTEFNVKDRSEGTSVVLNKGSVRVKLQHGNALPEELLIKPGEMVEYKPREASLSRSQVDTVRYSSWKQNLLIFEETPLEEVAQTIAHLFGYQVHFESIDPAALRFTGSSPADDLEMLLETLEKSFGLSISKSERVIRIRPDESEPL